MNLTAREHALLKVALHNPALRRQPAMARTLETLEGKLDAASANAEEHPLALRLAPIDTSGPKTEKALVERLAANPNDLEARLSLANLYYDTEQL